MKEGAYCELAGRTMPELLRWINISGLGDCSSTEMEGVSSPINWPVFFANAPVMMSMP